MHAELQALLGADNISVAAVDVDADEMLVAQFDELVPVLIGNGSDGKRHQLCHYFLNTDSVRAFFSAEKRLALGQTGTGT